MVGGDRALLPADRPAEPATPPAFARAILESLAFKYRAVLESLEELTGTRFERDPHRRRRLAQPAAQSVHRRRHRPHRRRRAGRGDGARQHRHADAGDRRRLVARRGARGHRSFVPGRTVRARRRGSLGRALSAVSRLRGVDLCLRHDDRNEIPQESLGRRGGRRAGGASARAPALPLESARRRSAHHELWRRQHQLEVRSARSADRRAAACDGGEGQRRRPAIDGRRPVSRCSISTSSNV